MFRWKPKPDTSSHVATNAASERPTSASTSPTNSDAEVFVSGGGLISVTPTDQTNGSDSRVSTR